MQKEKEEDSTMQEEEEEEAEEEQEEVEEADGTNNDEDDEKEVEGEQEQGDHFGSEQPQGEDEKEEEERAREDDMVCSEGVELTELQKVAEHCGIEDEDRKAQVEATQKRMAFELAKAKRQEEETHSRDLTCRRLAEVLNEIEGHMEEILRRTSLDALAAWKDAPPEVDRRELYMRLVHANQEEPVLRAPEALNAELLPHQVEGLEWLVSLFDNGLHGILADEMGLGKTVQSIALLLQIQECKGNVGPHLIVAPKSCLSNWENEFAKFAPDYPVHVLTSDAARTASKREVTLRALRDKISRREPVVCITNFEQVHRTAALMDTKWQLVIVDEGHRLKNPDTVLHAAMTKLQCRMRLLLTGTPLQNSINELWALLHYLLPELFTHMMDFKAWFARPFKSVAGLNEYDIQLDAEQEQQVIGKMHGLLAPFLLQRLKNEVLADQLPPRVESTVRVPLSAWQRSAYSDLEQRTLRLLSDDGATTGEQVNNALMQLRKIALHPYLFEESFDLGDGLFRASGKAEALDRMLPKLLRFGHKTLIFSQFTAVLDVIEKLLKLREIDCVRLDGQVPHELRRERIQRFQEESHTNVFLLSARAGGLGLNLQAADTVVLFDMDWNPQNDKQAVARVHRVGQTKEVRVIRLVADAPVERHMEARCQEKLEMEQKIMGAGMFRKGATADQRRHALSSVLVGAQPADADAATPPTAAGGSAAPSADLTSPEDFNRMLARSAVEFETFTAMDEELKLSGWSVPGSQRGARSPARKLRRKTSWANAPDAPGSESVLQRLQAAGRLMRSEEVPAGFTYSRDAD